MVAEVFCWKEDEWAEELRTMGFYMGKFIYLMDAYEDYDRDKKKFFLTFKSVPGYTFKGGQKLLVHNNRLWVTDISTREIVGVDIFRNVIEEYE